VHFPAYATGDTAAILKGRARLALSKGWYSRKTLGQIAHMSCGDARVAIHTLYAAAQFAESEKLDAIRVDCLEKLWDDIKEAKLDYLLATLTEDHRILYYIVKQKGQILSRDLWQGYLRYCEQDKRRPLAARTFSDYVNRLAQIGLITSERARVKGKVRLFKSCC
jgi:Cdc6-like AAA superfamily ATPase